MIKTIATEKLNINVISQHSNTLKLNKSYILNKNVNLLASKIIIAPINSKNFMNIDFKTSHIPELDNKLDKEYLLSFTNNNYLSFLKEYMKHPYIISNTKIKNIIYFLEKTDSNLLIINDINCDSLTKLVEYTAFKIDINKLMNNDIYIPITIHKFIFNNN
jgi:hypothetical protein